MKKLFVLATLALATVPAQAQNFSFQINGRTVHIAVPKSCGDETCVSISTSKSATRRSQGIDEQKFDGSKVVGILSDLMAKQSDSSANDAPAATEQEPVAAVEPAPVPAPVAVQTPVAPPAPVAALAPPPAPATPIVPNRKAAVAPAPVVTARLEPAAASVEGPVQAANSPVGMWLTQNKEGKVHIVQCGANYCGYSVDSQSDRDGAKVLINMKATGDVQWSGLVHDPKGGGTYDATMALKSANALSVRGCAMGGFICRGQTWSRL